MDIVKVVIPHLEIDLQRLEVGLSWNDVVGQPYGFAEKWMMFTLSCKSIPCLKTHHCYLFKFLCVSILTSTTCP